MLWQNFSKETFQNLYQEHRSLEAVASVFKVSSRTLRRKLHELDINYSRIVRGHHLNDEFFSGENATVYFWAGWLISLANISEQNSRYRIEFNLSVQHLENLKLFLEAIGSDYPIRQRILRSGGKEYTYLDVTLTSFRAVQDLKSLWGMQPNNKKFTYKMPKRVVESKLVKHFIRGWTAGLGGLCVWEGKDVFHTTGTADFILQLRDILTTQATVQNIQIKDTKNLLLRKMVIRDTRDVEKVRNYLQSEVLS